jgi:hypothetical protein
MHKRYDTKKAAKFLSDLGMPFSAGTLEVWRCQGRGPRFVRLSNRIFYEELALLEYAKGEVVETSDSAHFA